MFCTNCGKKVEDGWKFCMFCGAAIGSVPAANSQTESCESKPAYAVLYKDTQELVFQRGDAVEAGRPAVIFEGVETTPYTRDDVIPPWHPSKKSECSNVKKVIFKDKIKPISIACWFQNYGSLTEIENIHNLDTSEVTNMDNAFSSCTELKGLLNLSTFDTSKVENMRAMFAMTGLTAIDISGFNTSRVKNMAYMFWWSALLETIYVSADFDTSSVEDDKNMFWECYALCGGNGDHYDEGFVRSDMAKIEGYFVKK